MNLSTLKWAQWDKTQSRELWGLFICVCIALCTIVAYNIAQKRPDNFPLLPSGQSPLLRWCPRNHVLDGGPGPHEGAILRGKHYLHSKWLAERARSTVRLQRNPSFGETPAQVHFSCRRLCWKVTKYDVHILWLTVSVYELFNAHFAVNLVLWNASNQTVKGRSYKATT